jgi:hypothetical protein
MTAEPPTALALGDLTGDGKVDLVTASYQSKSVGLWAGTGDGRFAAKVDLTTEDHPGAMAVGDVNGDGKLDIVTAGSASDEVGSVSVLLGKGGGDFATAVNYPSGSGPHGLALADLNGDGKLDLVVACAEPLGGKLYVFLGRGDGAFPASSTYDAGYQPTALGLADLNGDRRLDVVVGWYDVKVFLGLGDGSFADGVVYPAGDTASAIAIGDLTGDGKLDIIATMNLLPGRGDGTFAAPIAYPVAAAAPVLADMNRDGKLDIVALVGSNVTVLASSCLAARPAPR